MIYATHYSFTADDLFTISFGSADDNHYSALLYWFVFVTATGKAEDFRPDRA